MMIAELIFKIVIENSVYAKGAFREPRPSEIVQRFGKCKMANELPDTIDLYSWNMLTGLKKDWLKGFKDYSSKTNLFLLQETFFNEAQKKNFNDSLFCWTAGNAHVHIKTNVPSGVATGAFAKPLKTEVTYSKYYEPVMWVRQATLYSWFKIKKSQKPLLVVNVHAINFVPDYMYFEQIANIEKKIRKHNGPVIIAGDFNTFSLSKTKFVNLLVKKHKLKEVEFLNDKRKKFRAFPLDHIYVRGFNVVESQVEDSSLSSDHNALWTRLKLQ